MKKLRHFLGVFNYGVTWLGLFRFALGASCVWGCFRLYDSDEALPLRIFGIAIIAVSGFFCFALSFEDIKKGFKHLKYRDAERLVYRVPVSSHNEDE